jgi:NAD(P)-dependent dehydrogenase (short-subunit alcohol dehydrogenase family)
MDLGLQSKHAIVTGGSRGIGKAIARELAREGVDVAIVARNKGDLEASTAIGNNSWRRRNVPQRAQHHPCKLRYITRRLRSAPSLECNHALAAPYRPPSRAASGKPYDPAAGRRSRSR